MKTGEREIHSNGLNICIDWLSWTLSEPCSIESALQLMGYSMADFPATSPGPQRIPFTTSSFGLSDFGTV